jgi:hypothetical protein
MGQIAYVAFGLWIFFWYNATFSSKQYVQLYAKYTDIQYIREWCHDMLFEADFLTIESNYLIHEVINLFHEASYLIHEANYLIYEANYLIFEANYTLSMHEVNIIIFSA